MVDLMIVGNASSRAVPIVVGLSNWQVRMFEPALSDSEFTELQNLQNAE
ncbi:hypothetical protein [Mucilaginibacter celer]|nr:hypothetical protein [Mucilaginibacter celer]